MPHINVDLTKKLSPEKEQTLASRFGKLIPIIPGKKEARLMISIHDQTALYHGGIKEESAAYVEVKIFKDCPRENKVEFADKAIKMLIEELDLSEDHIYLNFFEVFDWATNGALM